MDSHFVLYGLIDPVRDPPCLLAVAAATLGRLISNGVDPDTTNPAGFGYPEPICWRRCYGTRRGKRPH